MLAVWGHYQCVAQGHSSLGLGESEAFSGTLFLSMPSSQHWNAPQPRTSRTSLLLHSQELQPNRTNMDSCLSPRDKFRDKHRRFSISWKPAQTKRQPLHFKKPHFSFVKHFHSEKKIISGGGWKGSRVLPLPSHSKYTCRAISILWKEVLKHVLMGHQQLQQLPVAS